uniref:aspartic proteinase-like protein 1 n=1 Tax=Erigeron canadensis TaxID=72917 RepID=UPI001CB8AA3C|nr:aspartic proteinase-like protein 1 [Erigeron canadensis]
MKVAPPLSLSVTLSIAAFIIIIIIIMLGECSSLSEQKSAVSYSSYGVSKQAIRVSFEKQKVNMQHQLLYPSAGGTTISGGNELGWLHYTYIAVGMPSVSFLVALDTGSDLLWLPCDCEQCAPLSDYDENEYNPTHSNTSKSITCSHQLCDLGPTCKNPKQPCPYTVNYASAGTSSSGSLVEDILHLAADGVNASNTYVRAPIIIGCGKEQSGGYLDGIAPDGVLGLGLGDVSVPSFLAKSGVTRNTFSLCFGESGSGNIYFGDQGLSTQRTTPFLPVNGKYVAYIIGVDNFCIGTTCLDQTSFKAQFDSGTTFTVLPDGIYKAVVKEFDRQTKATQYRFEGYPFDYCYKSSSQELPESPSVTIKFSVNNTFVVHDPLFVVNDSQGETVGFCLAIQSTPDEMGLIGQNFMKGYRLVFDRENFTLGWSRSKCQPLKGKKALGGNASSPIPLPTTEQQRSPPNANAVAPAFAGKTPKSSANSNMLMSSFLPILLSLLLLLFNQLGVRYYLF